MNKNPLSLSFRSIRETWGYKDSARLPAILHPLIEGRRINPVKEGSDKRQTCAYAQVISFSLALLKSSYVFDYKFKRNALFIMLSRFNPLRSFDMISFFHDVLESSAAPHHRALSRVRLPKQENSAAKILTFSELTK